MIPKENRLKKNSQFNYIYKHGLSKHSKFLSVSYIKTKFSPFKVGVTVSKKIGNSVVRNQVKRHLRESVRLELKNFDEKHNYIFIARKGINELDFNSIRKTVVKLLMKANLYKYEEN